MYMNLFISIPHREVALYYAKEVRGNKTFQPVAILFNEIVTKYPSTFFYLPSLLNLFLCTSHYLQDLHYSHISPFFFLPAFVSDLPLSVSLLIVWLWMSGVSLRDWTTQTRDAMWTSSRSIRLEHHQKDWNHKISFELFRFSYVRVDGWWSGFRSVVTIACSNLVSHLYIDRYTSLQELPISYSVRGSMSTSTDILSLLSVSWRSTRWEISAPSVAFGFCVCTRNTPIPCGGTRLLSSCIS